jgi:TonB family protein
VTTKRRGPGRATTLLACLGALGTVVLAAGAARAQLDGLSVPRPESPADRKEIQAKQLTKLPKQTRFVPAEYPKEAQARNITATVTLLLDINAEGKVDSVGLAEPAEPAGMGFDEAAMVAAQQFEFEPAELDGKKIPVQITYKYRFTLSDRSRAPATATGTATPAAPGSPAAAGGAAAGSAAAGGAAAGRAAAGGAAAGSSAPAAAGPSLPPARTPVLNLSGILRERGTRLPLPGVVVTVFRDDGDKPLGFESTSDDRGVFQFFDLTPGDWKVLLEPPGFYPYRTTETITSTERVNAIYYIERGSYNPYDVTVTATRPRKEVSRTVLSAQEIDKIPGAAGDPLAVVQNFAGVARTPVAGQIIIRGSAPQDSKVYIEGAEVPLIYHFGGLRSVVPVGLLDSIDFYPGNFSPMYGRATGGVIDVRLKKLQPKKIGGYADINVFDSGIYLEVPVTDTLAFAVAGRRSYIDYILNAAVPSDSNVNLVTAPRYYDYQFLANWRPAPAHDFRALFFGSDDRLALLFKNPANFSTDATSNVFSASTTFYRSLLTYRFVPSDRVENTLGVSQGRNWVLFRAGQLVFDLDTYTAQIRDSLRLVASQRLSLHVGFDGVFSRTDANVNLPRPPKEGDPANQSAPDLSQTIRTDRKGVLLFSPAGFAEAEWKPLHGLLLLPGLRFDYFSRIHQSVLQPRFTARFGVTEAVTLKGGLGLFVEEPTFDETDSSFGNPNLKAERAIHLSGGVEYKPRPWITLDATGFYKDIYDLVSPTTATAVVNGVSVPLVYDNNGRGTVYGLELVARHEFANRFTGWLAYTLSRATRRDSGQTQDRLFDFDQTHILTLIGSYLLPRNWQIGGRFRLVTGSPTTPVVGSVFNSNQDLYQAIYGATNTSRLPMFNQLDVRIDKSWINQGWILDLYMDVQNIYNRANVEGINYNYDFSQMSTQQGLPILTILGLRAEL